MFCPHTANAFLSKYIHVNNMLHCQWYWCCTFFVLFSLLLTLRLIKKVSIILCLRSNIGLEMTTWPVPLESVETLSKSPAPLQPSWPYLKYHPWMHYLTHVYKYPHCPAVDQTRLICFFRCKSSYFDHTITQLPRTHFISWQWYEKTNSCLVKGCISVRWLTIKQMVYGYWEDQFVILR